MRIACGIEYDGRCFCGWQVQRGVRTVQQVVEEAIAKVADHPIRVVCAGRTDAGVHASGQVIHFDTSATRTPRAWILGTNVGLPADVSLQWARPVGEDFHARFSALTRRYRYRILNRWVRSPLWHGRASWYRGVLDPARMAAAAALLLGEHDFSAFRSRACQARTPVRTIYRLEVMRNGEFVELDVEANGFLHHMVRNIAGALLAVGSGERNPEWIVEVLANRDRCAAGVTASPEGLYLNDVCYPPRHAIPCASPIAR